ncbi:MAG: aminotransferase class I/II-fold pyridoxal phosphate-dependent enzyme [Lachnospiraceae bacterium]|nr:aminotransferase class I/II-fold pyridoxal phosphate-dependent enzyme [Lachnospiraceae bacterium]
MENIENMDHINNISNSLKQKKSKEFSQESLLERLIEYSASDYYPFHMPGHKRKAIQEGMGFPNPYTIDITEIHGFDNLHHAEGILKDSMTQAAACYGADESWYLVNGSSGGILSAISGCTWRGGTILVSRNCHKSVYHGILINGLQAEYVYPQILTGLGIQGGIRPEDVEKKLEENPEIQAVMIVSPTYDGMVSDIKRIAEAAHRHGVPLLVDEAHGAHFPFGRNGEFPVSALELGADVVIQSLHKTLPSLTQTAILHMKQEYLGQERMERIRRYLSIYQSSSPSYVLMAAIENCIGYMDQEGRERLSQLAEELKEFREQCRSLRHIVIPGKEWIGQAGIYDMDCSKILMVTGCGRKSGVWLENFLRERHHLELEMCAPQYGLALTSLWDGREGLKRLLEGLKDADQAMDDEFQNGTWTGEEPSAVIPEAVCRISTAMEHPYETRKLEECEGRISAEFVYLYPPGIPYLVPGEVISNEMILKLIHYRKLGFEIQGIQDFQGIFLRTLKKK